MHMVSLRCLGRQETRCSPARRQHEGVISQCDGHDAEHPHTQPAAQRMHQVLTAIEGVLFPLGRSVKPGQAATQALSDHARGHCRWPLSVAHLILWPGATQHKHLCSVGRRAKSGCRGNINTRSHRLHRCNPTCMPSPPFPAAWQA